MDLWPGGTQLEPIEHTQAVMASPAVTSPGKRTPPASGGPAGWLSRATPRSAQSVDSAAGLDSAARAIRERVRVRVDDLELADPLAFAMKLEALSREGEELFEEREGGASSNSSSEEEPPPPPPPPPTHMESVHDDDDEAGDEPRRESGLVRRGGGAPRAQAKEPQGAAEQHEQYKQHKQQWRWQQRRQHQEHGRAPRPLRQRSRSARRRQPLRAAEVKKFEQPASLPILLRRRRRQPMA